MTPSPNPDRTLRLVLRLDAASSAAAGILMVAGHAALAPWLGLSPTLLLMAGVALLPYALLLWRLAARTQVRSAWVWAVAGINALWAVDSLALLGLGWQEPTVAGQVFVIGQALVVLAFADVQAWLMYRGRAARRRLATA